MKSAFNYTAYFYKLNSQEQHCCRRYLHIKRVDHDTNKPDLTIIMLNPGSCKAFTPDYEKEVDAKPDPTLHRIRSLMENINFNWVQVLNLTDLQDAHSKSLFEKIKELSVARLSDHSVFDKSRREELKSYLDKNNLVYFACGVNLQNSELLKNARVALNEIGAKVISGDHLYHPLVRPNKSLNISDWREQAAEILANHLYLH